MLLFDSNVIDLSHGVEKHDAHGQLKALFSSAVEGPVSIYVA
jgi:hypothetical protein